MTGDRGHPRARPHRAVTRGDALRAGGDWRGLLLHVPPRTAGLHVEAAPPRHLRITQSGRTVLWAIVARDHGSVAWQRGAWEPVVPPVDARTARRIAGRAGAEREAAWAHWFAGALERAANGPLDGGHWTLRPHDPALAEHVVTTEGNGTLDWWYDVELLPLRDLPEPGNARVKAHRRRVREGTATPVLVWWVAPLAAFAILDGHARLVAARTEGVAPSLLALTAIRDPATVTPEETHEAFYEARRSGIYAHGGAGTDHAAEIERLVAEAQRRREMSSTTRGTPLRGGVRAWRAEVAEQAPLWRPAEI